MIDYYSRDEALKQVNEVIEMIADACEKFEIAGSIRREKPHVHDAEIVVIPRWNLFQRLDMLVINRKLRKAEYPDKNGRISNRWGAKYRGVTLRDADMRIEIFTSDKDSYGYQLWLRTGPGQANEELVTTLKYRSPFLARDGYIWLEPGQDLTESSRKISVPDEETFFRLLNIPFELPAERGKHYQKLNWKSHTWGTPEQFVEEPKAESEPKQVKLL